MSTERLEKLAKTLPTTADHVRVGILEFVWARTGHRYCVIDGYRAQWDPPLDQPEPRRRVGDSEFLHVCGCYSSPELVAAVA
jgi:hypothetical protein